MIDEILSLLADPSAELAVAAPGDTAGFWAGGPSAVFADDRFYLAYRLRRPVDQGRGFANVVASSADGVEFVPHSTLSALEFECASLERPALVRRPDGGWRIYVSCSTPNSKHWWVAAVDADSPAELATGEQHMVLPGDVDTAFKDPVVRVDDDGWHLWACRHPLDGGDDEADRMTTVYFTSDDGLDWAQRSVALAPTPHSWDARGTRLTSVLPHEDGWLTTYDGRASAAENWFERTGVALGDSPDALRAVAGPTPAGRTIRYVTLVERPDHYRLYWEASRDADSANDVRTAKLPRSVSSRQE